MQNIKLTKKWTKGEDFITGLARYTFEERDPSNTAEKIRVVICQDKRKDSLGYTKTIYQCFVENIDKECADELEFFDLKTAKFETEKLFNEYCNLFPESV